VSAEQLSLTPALPTNLKFRRATISLSLRHTRRALVADLTPHESASCGLNSSEISLYDYVARGTAVSLVKRLLRRMREMIFPGLKRQDHRA
jgi:hypothetical protein